MRDFLASAYLRGHVTLLRTRASQVLPLTLVTLDEKKKQNLLICRGAIYPQEEKSKVVRLTRRINQSRQTHLKPRPKSSDSFDAATKVVRLP
ncbi:hypothetical protein TNCV_773341 [Trichonephila clavipes]|nr:hypothetical protein TNCV_773341 [Trichonephila clavipes]